MFYKLGAIGVSAILLSGCITLPPSAIILIERDRPVHMSPPAAISTTPPIDVSVTVHSSDNTVVSTMPIMEKDKITKGVSKSLVSDNPDPPRVICKELNALLAMDTFNVNDFLEGENLDALLGTLLARVHKTDNLLQGIRDNGQCQKENYQNQGSQR